MKILITGSTGFVGSKLLKYFPEGEIVIFLRGDDPVEKLKGIDVIIHLAGKAHDKGAVDSDFEINNFLLTKSLIDTAKNYNVKKFIFVSTSKVYGECSDQPWDENSPCLTSTPYGLSKLKCEKYLVESGLNYIIFRPPLILGENSRGNLGLLGKVIKLNIPLPLNINNKRSYLEVEYFCKKIKDSIYIDSLDNQIFNIANMTLSTSELFRNMGHKNFIRFPSVLFNIIPDYYKTKIISNYELNIEKISSYLKS